MGDSAHCRPTTSSFSRFFRFVGRRQTIFIVFRISSADDGRFFPFSVLRPWPKRSFSCFSSFGHGRNAIFPDFRSSATAETQLFLFFIFRPRPKCNFSRFPLFGHGRNTVFPIFRSSATAETHFSSDFHSSRCPETQIGILWA